MVAYAQCLWIAALSAPRSAPFASGPAGQSPLGLSHPDDRRLGNRSLERREALSTAPTLSHHHLCALAVGQTPSCMSERDGGTLDGTGERSTERRLNETHGRHQFRSLSYLSLTLRCAALPSGWLEGCVTPSFPKRDVRISTADRGHDSREGEGHQKHRSERERSAVTPVVPTNCRNPKKACKVHPEISVIFP